MKNFRQPGNTLTLTAPRDVLSGEGFIVGGFFGIAVVDALTGVDVEADLVGVYDLPKAAAVTPAQGGDAYWDNTNFEVTTSAAGNTKIGAFTQAALAGDQFCRVRLNGTA